MGVSPVFTLPHAVTLLLKNTPRRWRRGALGGKGVWLSLRTVCPPTLTAPGARGELGARNDRRFCAGIVERFWIFGIGVGARAGAAARNAEAQAR